MLTEGDRRLRLIDPQPEAGTPQLLRDVDAQLDISLVDPVDLGVDPGVPGLLVLALRIDGGRGQEAKRGPDRQSDCKLHHPRRIEAILKIDSLPGLLFNFRIVCFCKK